MKKNLLLIAAILMMYAAQAQTNDHVTAGVTGALNFAKLNTKLQNNSADPGYKFATDGLFGYWVNIPLSRRLSLEPQMIFVSDRFKPENGGINDFDGKVNYVGIPVLLKIHAHKYIAFPVGVQLDLRTSEKPGNGPYQKTAFESYSFGVTGGVEILPNARFSLFGRYIYGINKTNINRDAPTRAYDFTNQNIYAGLKIKLFDFKKKPVVVPPPPPPPQPKDTDGDGVNDDDDKCPTVPGLAKYQGCPIPDTDKDGINDEEDKCPTVPGLAKYQGCPIPDTDKDGINDEQDKCPTVPGVSRYNGCPVPDTDGDGINDEEDKCPNLAGVRENQGCPAITEEVKKRVDLAARNILFVTGSAKLQSKSYKGLNDVVKVMQENPDMKLSIDGHTDNVGSDELNQKLSDNRAASVRTYIVSKGIDESRIVSAGHGETMPIADNKTAAGRQQNRRVEMKLSYYQ